MAGLLPGTVVELVVERPAAGGRMIARHAGQIVLVRGAIPGERVRARLERVDRQVAYATVVDVPDPSPDRRRPTADPACGGSLYAHIAYPRQLALKSEVVADAFRRIGKIALDAPVAVEPSPETGYRMRARLHVRGTRVGFFREGTHELCDAGATGQLLPDTGTVLARVAAALAEVGAPVVAAIELAENLEATERALHLELRPEARVPPAAFSGLARVPGVTGVTAVAPPGDVLVLGGRPQVSDPLAAIAGAAAPAGARLCRKATSFFQANRFLLPTLVARVAGWVGPGPAIDLYAGVGLFAVALAALGHERVTAVEGDRGSAADLAENAAPFAGRVRVVHQAVEAFLGAYAGEPAETLLVDPPRTGLSRAAASGIAAHGARRLVYVSCDVATLARDVGRLLQAGYTLVHLEAFDLFPNTPHVEALAVLDRRRTP
jgi:23S rRNA (uracil1939-C5)-methyltransferase